MTKIRLPEKKYNTAVLSALLKSQFPGQVRGMSGVRASDGSWLKDKDGNDVYDADLADGAAPEIEAQIIALAEAHDGTERTPEEAQEEARKADFDRIKPAQIEAMITRLEAGTATNAQVQTTLAAVLKLLRHLAT